jgi:hypothetical protein
MELFFGHNMIELANRSFYIDETGTVRWNFDVSIKVRKGDPAGYKKKNQFKVTFLYKEINIFDIAWAIHHGCTYDGHGIYLDGNVTNHQKNNLLVVPKRISGESDILALRPVLENVISYDRKTGDFIWRSHKNLDLIGKPAGHITTGGYKNISIFSHHIYAHRLAYILEYGQIPDFIDHIDGNRLNNAITNLRSVTRTVNAENKRKNQNGTTTGLLGVHLHKQTGKFCASIKTKGKRIYIGLFLTSEDAFEAYVKKKREIHVGCTI